MKKQHSWPEGHWNWPISVTHKHGVRCGDMIWIGGQVNLTPDGVVLNPNNLIRQIAAVVKNIATVLNDCGAGLTDLVYLNAFYVNGGSVNEADFLSTIADYLPEDTCTAITAVPVPYLAYDGMLIEIEAYAMRAGNGDSLARQYAPDTAPGERSAKFCTALRCGKMIFTSAQSPINFRGELVGQGSIIEQSRQVANNLKSALNHFGADFDDVVKTNRWYCGGDGIDDFEPAALVFASNFAEPGPAATGIPIPKHANPDEKIRIAVIAMISESGKRLQRRHAWPESLWDWHVHLPYQHGVKCDNMIFLGGQVSLDKKGAAVHANELTAQTHQAMAHIQSILNELGADYQDVCKVMTVYKGDCGADALHSNLPVRSSYFDEPGPATTGIPLPVLAYEGMCIEIDIYAMAEAD